MSISSTYSLLKDGLSTHTTRVRSRAEELTLYVCANALGRVYKSALYTIHTHCMCAIYALGGPRGQYLVHIVFLRTVSQHIQLVCDL